MKNLIATLVMAASSALAAFDVVSFVPGNTATGTVATTMTNSIAAIGAIRSITFYCQTNSTCTVSAVANRGISVGATRPIFSAVLAAGSYTTNLASPVYVYGDWVDYSVASVLQLATTGTSAKVVVER
jgi:hypothetical protein